MLSFEIMFSPLCFRGANFDLHSRNLATVAEKSFKDKKLQRRDDFESNRDKSENSWLALVLIRYTVSDCNELGRSLQGSDFLSFKLPVVLTVATATGAFMMGKYF